MRIITLNVNGLQACIKKGLIEFIKRENPDIICLQETRAKDFKTEELGLENYKFYCNHAEKAGYSGTMILSKKEGKQITSALEFDNEGRLTVIELETAYIINVYVPNAFRKNLRRRNYRAEWDEELNTFVEGLHKPIILCGDFNVDIDFIEEKGFMSEEKESFERLKSFGLKDVYRSLFPDASGFTWYSGRNHVGKRLDAFLVSESAFHKIKHIEIYDENLSDHLPMGVHIDE